MSVFTFWNNQIFESRWVSFKASVLTVLNNVYPEIAKEIHTSDSKQYQESKSPPFRLENK